MSSTTSKQCYPRPDFERSNLRWTSLNGPWDFLFDDEDVGLSEGWHYKGLPDQVFISTLDARSKDEIWNPEQKQLKLKTHQKSNIQVPFVFQAAASGIGEKGAHEILWYERQVSDPRSSEERNRGHRILLRFGAVDYEATIWLDGLYVGFHRGGHVPFDLDLTDAFQFPAASVEEPKRLTVRVRDSPYDLTQPRGKQYWEAQPESIFYTPSSGIWQSVWLESVPSTKLADSSCGTIIRSNDVDSGELHANIAVLGRKPGHKYSVELEGSIGGVVAGKQRADLRNEMNHISLDLSLRLSDDQLQGLPASILQGSPLSDDHCWRQGLAIWSPEHPLLYDLVLRLYDPTGKLVDEVNTSTGMRSLNWTTGDGSFRLNGKPYLQMLVLDQGYWPQTGITPPSPESLKADIELSKKMGFNGCRKHQKIEDPLFLYWADRLGYLVWGEMANGYQFSQEYVERFNQEWMEAVKRDINHPCIVTWTPVNESWGYNALADDIEQQNHIRTLYYMTKTLDPTRSINDNCGWGHVLTDLVTFHDYSDGPELTETCKTIEGILQKKSNQDIFIGSTSNFSISDPGVTPLDGAPILCTEFGGVNIAPADPGVADGEKDWGYTTASDPQDLLRRIENLVMGIVKGGCCCGFVYTQLTDIEQEVNGLYSFDRREKLKAESVKDIMDTAQKIYYEQLSRKIVNVVPSRVANVGPIFRGIALSLWKKKS